MNDTPTEQPPAPDGRSPVARLRLRSLALRLLVVYLVPTLLLFAIFALVTMRLARTNMEGALGRRLVSLARAAALELRPEAIAFLGPGDEESRTAHRVRHKLRQLCQATGLERAFVVDRKHRSRIDSRGKLRIGERYYHAESARAELRQVFRGRSASSVLFRGAGGRYYMTGFAPIVRADGSVIAAVGVEGDAKFFADLDQLRRVLLATGTVVSVALVLTTLVISRRITTPLRRLARAARRIGAGELEEPIAVRSGDEVGLLATTMNRMREQLHRRDQEMQMMLSGIAHEVRNPLGGIALFAGILREDLRDDPSKSELVERIERELGYLQRVVNDFLDYARRAPLTKQPVELLGLLEDTARLLAAEATEASVNLSVEGREAWVEGDPDQLRRVAMNLVKNAIQAQPNGGQVVLLTGRDARGAYFVVNDNGPGIARKMRERILQPFFTTRQQGTGLGLALSQKIVTEHGGTLEAQEVPRGASIRVALPAGRGQVR